MIFNFVILDDYIRMENIPYFSPKKKKVNIKPKGYSINGYPTLNYTKKRLQQKNNLSKKRGVKFIKVKH